MRIPSIPAAIASRLCAGLLALAACAAAQAQVSNTATITAPPGVTDSNPGNNTSTVVTPLAGVVASSKSAVPASGTTVAIGQQISYTLTSVVTSAPLATALTLTDVLSPGLAFGAVTSSVGFSCSGTGPVVCTLPAGTAVGTYSVTYTATVTAAATLQVGNTVTPSEGSCTSCSTEHPLVAVSTNKTSDVGDGTPVQKGQQIVYTVTSTVSGGGSLTTPLVLTDTLGTGLTFDAIASPGAFTCQGGNPVRCTLPAGTPAGAYPVSYRVMVNDAATTSVRNTVVPNEGSCVDCTTENPLVGISTRKDNVTPGNNVQVSAGSVVVYRITTTVTGGPLTRAFTATDTLGTGLTFTAVDATTGFTCNAANPLVCTLAAGTPAGTYTATYRATVAATATVAVQNSVVPSDGDCVDCNTINPLVDVVTRKSSNVGNGTGVQAGETIVYTLTTLITGGAPLATPLVLTDTLSAGLAFGAITSAGSFSCTGGNPVVCTLPAGTVPGSYQVSYSAVVQAAATTSVSNTVVPNQGGCTDCTTDNPLLAIATSKTSNVGNGTAVERGDLITYTVTSVISGGGELSRAFTLTDTLGPGLEFNAITSAGAYSCNTANPIVCTLPVGTVAGSYPVSYSARVSAAATTSVSNTVVPSDGTCTTCTTTNPLVEIATRKTLDVGSGTPVSKGQTLTYTVTSVITGGALTHPLVLTDTLGAGLVFGAVTAAGGFTCNAANPVVCTLPTGTAAGSHSVTYTVTVGPTAGATVNNSVVPSDGTCTDCRIVNPLTDPVVTYGKSVTLPAGKTAVAVGDTLTYTLTATVTVAPTSAITTLTDTLGPGLQFIALTSPGPFTCTGSGPLVCTLPAGTAVGAYSLSYTAQVTAAADGSVRNTVLGSGDDNPGCSSSCTTDTPVLTPVVDVSKSADPSSGTQVERGQVLRYTLTAVVSNAPLTSPLVLTDTPDAGLTVAALPAGCNSSGTQVVCTLPAGTPIGVHAVSYDATVNAQAGSIVNNTVAAAGGGPDTPGCQSCSTSHKVEDPELRITKTAGAREVKVGDLVLYTLQIENLSNAALVNGSIVDTTPAGFSFASGSLKQSNGNPLTVTGAGPVRLGNLNLPGNSAITVSYLMRVGAGVRQGTHVNQAQALSPAGTPISNVATAQVVLTSDPLTDESLIHGTVFDDRDGDGWQDRADLSDVRVQGGFAAGDYVPGSTTVDRGDGPQPQADASAPLLHGLALGAISARGSDADPPEHHQVIVSQRLREARFSDDFVLTDAQGVTVRMDAQGNTTLERGGEAAKGLNAAAPRVERRVSADADGTRVDYIIRNQGVDERGIPGVRIATVEGLLVETDQFGRYHLVGIDGGEWEHGRNFVMKIDPVTLPPGAEMTTDNPLLRRITPGVPVRFDFGVRMPVGNIGGGSEDVQAVLGKVLFAPGSAVIAERYLPAVDRMAEQLHGRRGEVTLSASGDPPSLSFARATALRQALEQRLSADDLAALQISVRDGETAEAPLVVGWSEGGVVLGSLLFDYGKAAIRPGYDDLLDGIASELERGGGGRVAIIGYTDVHGSYEYNTRLGLQRARAVFDALVKRLSPAVRARVKVEASADPRKPVASEGGARP